MLKISEASKKVDLPVATIRYYAELNMIPSLKRNLENQRVFDDESIAWLEGIKFFRELGMPISEIQEYIQLSQKDGKAALVKRHQLLIKQEQKAQDNVTKAQTNLDELKRRITLEDEIIKGHKRDSLSPARRFNQ
ncbi:MerR family transcriptional regulator [Companilactobacillus sp. HBUAS56275]|jgi:Predicted transcriptional regulators|uniref:MerR family transcriptional regulator n=1 Tax=Candidatus Companilactobacillus pullicola TaxID=2838523 RepID=A0A9D2CPB5_9LACO|nr:MerR family transcriptional regulator [Candidatus Companilactobacillus pullicola]